MTTILDLAKKFRDVLILAGFFLTLGGFIVKPYAETFIKQTVNDRIMTLEEQLKAVQDRLAAQSQSQNRAESDLSSLKALNMQLLDLLEKLAARDRTSP